MENLTWKDIAAAVTGLIALLVTGVPAVNYLSGRVDAWRKRRAEKRSIDLSEAAELKRLEGDDRERAFAAVWKLYEDAKAKIEKLEAEIDELQKGDSLSRPTVSRIYQAVRKLGRQIEILDSVFIKEFIEECSPEEATIREAIKKEMEILWQKFDELEKVLPGWNI